MSDVIEIPAKEELDRHFSALIDSCGLIEGYVAGNYGNQTIVANAENKATVERNTGHLKYMRDKPWWTGYDMTRVNAAITAGDAYSA